MRPISIILIWLLIIPAAADEKPATEDPDTAFRNGLRVLERRYVTSMRELAENAQKIRIVCIGDEIEDSDPFADYPTGKFFQIQEGGRQRIFKVTASFELAGDLKPIRRWAGAVLPVESHPFAVCVPTPGFAVRFFDGRGRSIYASTICMKCQSSALEFPRYSGRIGIDITEVRKLIRMAGLDGEKPKSEQGGADQPATAPESKSEGDSKPKLESEVRRQ